MSNFLNEFIENIVTKALDMYSDKVSTDIRDLIVHDLQESNWGFTPFVGNLLNWID